MAIFNRILNILVMIMAVLAALFSWKLYERRKEMRDRGDTMAKKIYDAALALDAKTPEADRVAKDVGVQGIEKGEGKLGWKNFHDPTKRQGVVASLEKVVSTAGKVVKQRDDNSTRLTAVDQRFREHTDNMLDTYNDPTQAEAAFTALEAVLKEFFLRDNAMGDKLLAANQLFHPKMEATREQKRKDYAKMFDSLYSDIRTEQIQNTRKTDTLENMARVLKKKYFGVEPQDVKMLSEDSKNKIADKVKEIYEGLEKIVILEGQIRERDNTIREKQTEIDGLNTQIQRKDVQIADLQEKEKNLNNKIKMLTEQLRIARGDNPNPEIQEVKYDGNILKVNYDYNYVIITFEEGKGQKLPVSATLTVARDREYIAKVQVTKVFKSYAVADILPNEREGEIIEGDRVLNIAF